MATNIAPLPPSSTLILFSLAISLVGARPWQGAQKTAIYREDDWSPRPTLTSVRPRDIFRRDQVDVAVCGWKGGNLASPVACESGSSCVYETVHGYVGCCATSGPCTAGVYTSCIDQNCGSSDGDSGLVDSGIYTCSSGTYCNKNTYPGGYSQYSCGSSGEAATVETSFTGQPSDMLLQIVYTGIFFTPSPSDSVVPISAVTSFPLSSLPFTSLPASAPRTLQSQSSGTFETSLSLSQSSSLISSSIPFPTPTVSSFSTSSSCSPTTRTTSNIANAGLSATNTSSTRPTSHIKAIVGGMIGGLAALTIILGIFLFFLQRRRGKQDNYRAGPFVSGLKNGKPITSKEAKRDSTDSVEPFMSESSIPSVPIFISPNHRVNLLGCAAQSTPYSSKSKNGREQEEVPLVANEIDESSREFNNIARHHRSNSQEQVTEPEYRQLIRQTRGTADRLEPFGLGIEIPTFAVQHRFSVDEADVISPISASANAAMIPASCQLKRGGSGDSERKRKRDRDRLMGENKEDEENTDISTASLNREFGSKGWSPQHLRLSLRRSLKLNAGLGLQRYELVDEVPTEGVQVLSLPGQFKDIEG